MKKLLTLALVALGFTAAQAVTINWSATKNVYKGDMAAVLWNGDTASAAEFVAAAVPAYSYGVIGDFKSRLMPTISWCDTQSTEKPARAQIGSNNSVDTWGGYSNNGATSGSFAVFTSSYTADHKAAWDDVATIIFFNGTSADAHYHELTAGQVQTLIAGTDLNVDVGVVPEPTALALLALGVAGLALKRKVA